MIKKDYLSKKNISQAQNYLLILFAFSLPISPSISSIIIGLLSLKFIFSKKKIPALNNVKKNKVSFSIILFFSFIFISVFWFKGNNEILSLNSNFIYEINKMWILLLCPLLFLLNFDLQTKKYVKYAFIGGLIVNVFLSFLIYIYPDFIFISKTGHYINEHYLHGFLDHSDLSIFFCFGIFLLLENLIPQKKIYVLLIITLLIFLFNSYGRTGIICFIILLPFFLSLKYTLNLNVFLKIIIPSAIVMVLIFSFSKSLSNRASNTINEIKDLLYGVSLKEKVIRNANYMSSQDKLGRNIDYWKKRIQTEKNENGDLFWLNNIKKNKNETKTSLGKRLELWNTYIKKIKDNKILGTGLGSVSYFKKTDITISENPHNYYLFVMTEFGIVGLLLLVNIFITMIEEYFRSKEKNILKIIFPIMILLSLCANDYLFIYNTLAFFGLFSYLLYSDEKEY